MVIDLSRHVSRQFHGAALYVDLGGNDIQCDCRLVANLATFDKISTTSMPSIAANPGAWRNLNCSGPELFAGFTVAEFSAYSLCPVSNIQRQGVDEDGDNEDDGDEDRDGTAGRRHTADGSTGLNDERRRIRVSAGNHSILLPAVNQANTAPADGEGVDRNADRDGHRDDGGPEEPRGSHRPLLRL